MSSQVSETFVNILDVINSAMVWMTWIILQISSSSRIFGMISWVPTKFGTIDIFMFHNFFKYINMSFLWEPYSPALADGHSLEFEWEQVSSSLQKSSKDPGQSQQCCSLDYLHTSSYFQVLQPLNQYFGDCTVCNNYNWYHYIFSGLFCKV